MPPVWHERAVAVSQHRHKSPSPVTGEKRLRRARPADDLPTWSAPNRWLVGKHSVLSVRHFSLLTTPSRANLLLHRRRASRGRACEVT